MHPNDTTLHDYADGSCSPAECRSIEQHLASCASCRQLVDDLKELARAVSALPLLDPPVRVWSRIERGIKLEREHGGAPGLPGGARGVQPGGGADAGLKG